MSAISIVARMSEFNQMLYVRMNYDTSSIILF